MDEILRFKKANCKNCFKCLRECPVKAIDYKDGQAEIKRDECLICGHCLTVCPQNAKIVRNDVDSVKSFISSGRRVVASVAPSFAAAFNCGIDTFSAALKKLGFFGAFETSAGAVSVTREYEKIVAERRMPCVISSACPTIVKLIEMYHPEALRFLAPVVSPMTAHAKILKKSLGDIFVVFIGPCICKKDEAGWEEEAVDSVLTFEELSDWLSAENVELFEDGETRPSFLPPESEDDLDGEPVTELETAPADAPAKVVHAPGASAWQFVKRLNTDVLDNDSIPLKGAPLAGRMYPIVGGIAKTMKNRTRGINYVTVEGIDKCLSILDELRAGELEGFFIEMSACSGSCLNGPCMLHHGGYLSAHRRVENYARRMSVQISPHDDAGVDLYRSFEARPPLRQKPGEREIRVILAKTGKLTKAQELNCGACGYATCRDKAVAVYQGKAEVGMCMPYMRERAEYFSDKVISFSPNAIIVLDNLLSIQVLNDAACRLFGIEDAKLLRGRYIGELTDASAFEEALVRHEDVLGRKIYLFRYEKYVEQSVIYVKDHDIIFAILRDLTDSERQNESLKKMKLETVQTADNVIEKQMRVVQEIAMLLGETTAETKVALTKLKGTIMSEED